MKIQRRGASANHGVKAVELRKMKYKWNASSDTFDASSGAPAFDFSTTAKHNYNIRLTLNELSDVIDALGRDCVSIDKDEFAEAFSKSVPALVRIMARASGIGS